MFAGIVSTVLSRMDGMLAANLGSSCYWCVLLLNSGFAANHALFAAMMRGMLGSSGRNTSLLLVAGLA